jgi:hypothetical protein
MESMRSTWTDERLDDLASRMDRGFDRVDAELRAVNVRIDGLQRTMIQVAIAMTAAFLAGFAGLAALIATQI